MTRKNYIIRRSINLSKQSHIIAANVDQVLLVVTLALPRTSAGFIDRFLLTAEAYHIPAILVFNKVDLFEDDQQPMKELTDYISIYETIGYTCWQSFRDKKMHIDLLVKLTKDKLPMISGHSELANLL